MARVGACSAAGRAGKAGSARATAALLLWIGSCTADYDALRGKGQVAGAGVDAGMKTMRDGSAGESARPEAGAGGAQPAAGGGGGAAGAGGAGGRGPDAAVAADSAPATGGLGGGGSGGSAGAGGSGGSAGAGGSGGSAGAGGSGGSAGGCQDPAMIDDVEDGDLAICPGQGRAGTWSVTDDGTGQSFPKPLVAVALAPNDRPGSKYATHVWGQGFSSWGVAVSIHLDQPPGSVPRPYDAIARGHTGLGFWAKGTAAYLIAGFQTAATMPPASGGRCLADCSSPFVQTVFLTKEWRLYKVPFAGLTQTTRRPGQSFSATELMMVDLNAKGSTIDLWMDDVFFY
jgi:hypothetical protein